VSFEVLHGRTRELERIGELLEQARQGRGAALIVLGDPGIGKTALLEAAGDAAHDMLVLGATGVEAEAQLPFAALGEIAAPLVEGMPGLPEPQADALATALALRPVSRPTDRLAAYAGFLGLVRGVAQERPVLILVDDAQWLDSASTECLGFAARRLVDHRIGMLAAARPVDPHAALRGRIADELELGELDPQAARAVLHDSPLELANEAAEQILAAALGNPLALRELPRMLTEEQRQGMAPLAPLPAPEGALGEAFSQRAAEAGSDARRAMLVAAASSSQALTPVVAACRELGIPSRALEDAEGSGLLTLATDTIAFTHPLLRAVVYQGAAPAERRRAHYALSNHTDQDARAWHLAAAAVGPDPVVAAALDQAAGRATARGAHSVAADALERAAQATEPGDARAQRFFLAGLAAALGAAYARSAALLEPATEISDPRARARARHLLAMATLTGAGRTALTNHKVLTDEADTIFAVDPALAATFHSDAALAAIVASDCRLALASARRAAEVLPAGAPAVARCHVLAMLGLSLALRGQYDDARNALDAASPLLPEVDALTPAAQSIAFGFAGRHCLGQEEEMRHELGTLVALAREGGSTTLRRYAQLLLSDSAYGLGDWDAAERAAEEAVAIADDFGKGGPLSIALVMRGQVHAARGEESEARADLSWALRIADPPGYLGATIRARAVLGFLELGLGRAEEAVEELEEAARIASDSGMVDPLRVPFAPDLVEAYARVERMDDARSLAGDLSARARASPARLASGLAERCQGVVAIRDFEHRFERSLEDLRYCGARFEVGRSLLAFGARLHRARERAKAREQLRAALDVFDQLGAAPWSARAAAELRAAGARRRHRAADPDDLTAQEVRVAMAVARGATSRQVAAELFLSPKTIEFHLTRVYRKLGIRSRAELATAVATGRLGQMPGHKPPMGS
jgi:DNA-binding CsgD family transcriptional regulator